MKDKVKHIVSNIIEPIKRCRMAFSSNSVNSYRVTDEKNNLTHKGFIILSVKVDGFKSQILDVIHQNQAIKFQWTRQRKFYHRSKLLLNLFRFRKQIFKDVKDSKIKILPYTSESAKKSSKTKIEDYLVWPHHESFGILRNNLLQIFSRKSRDRTVEDKDIFDVLKKDADIGSPLAQYHVGICYENGVGVYKSSKKAVKYYSLSADNGNEYAQLSLATLYGSGDGVAKSDKKMFYYYKLAADQGNSLAQALLGKCYEKGRGTIQSLEKAVSCYQLSADQGSAYGLKYLAYAHQHGYGVDKSLEKAAIYRNRALAIEHTDLDVGDFTSALELGEAFLNGDGVDQSNEMAFHYIKIAAHQGNSLGQFMLAECYANGTGTDKSEEKAMHYYQSSANQGFEMAQFELGLRLLQGKGLRKSSIEAVEYFKLILAETGFESTSVFKLKAQYYLATCYENGTGVPKSNVNALHFYILAADQGLSQALNELGQIYLDGRCGVTPSPEKAWHYFKLSADQHDAEGECLLAGCYADGIGVDPSEENAKAYYSLSAEHGYVVALYELIDRLLSGHGMKRSVKEAMKYCHLILDREDSALSSPELIQLTKEYVEYFESVGEEVS